MERYQYPSDITLEQFEQICPALEAARKKTKPREVDLYDVFCAILYILNSGCQWRMLPSDFPNWELVYYYYRAWSDKRSPDQPSILEEILKKKLVKREREMDGNQKQAWESLIHKASKTANPHEKKVMMEARKFPA